MSKAPYASASASSPPPTSAPEIRSASTPALSRRAVRSRSIAVASSSRACSRRVFPAPVAPQTTSGLYTTPGASATRRAACTASSFASPITRLANPAPSAMLGPGPCRLFLECAGDPRQHLLDDRFERLEHARPRQRRRLERGEGSKVQRILQRAPTQHVREIPLVVLEAERHAARIHTLVEEVRLQVPEAGDVFLEPVRSTVRDEDHAVGSLKHQPAGRVVVDLARDGVELDLRPVAGEAAEVERKVIEEERAIALCRQGDDGASTALRHPRVDVLQVRRLAGTSGYVVDDLRGDLPRREVDDGHC